MNGCPARGFECCSVEFDYKPNRVFVGLTPDRESSRLFEAVRSVLEDRGLNFSACKAEIEPGSKGEICKACEGLQSSAHCLFEISDLSPNVILQLGLAIGLGKHVVTLVNRAKGERARRQLAGWAGIEQVVYADLEDLKLQVEEYFCQYLRRNTVVYQSPLASGNYWVFQTVRPMSGKMSLAGEQLELDGRQPDDRVGEVVVRLGSERLANLDLRCQLRIETSDHPDDWAGVRVLGTDEDIPFTGYLVYLRKNSHLEIHSQGRRLGTVQTGFIPDEWVDLEVCVRGSWLEVRAGQNGTMDTYFRQKLGPPVPRGSVYLHVYHSDTYFKDIALEGTLF